MAVHLLAPELKASIDVLRVAVQEAASDLGEVAVDLGTVLGAVVDAVKANTVATISNTVAVEENTVQQDRVASLLEQLIVILSPPSGPPQAGTAGVKFHGEVAGFYPSTGDSEMPTDKTLATLTLPAAPPGKDAPFAVAEWEWDRGNGPEPQPTIEGPSGSEFTTLNGEPFGAPEGSKVTFHWKHRDNSGDLSDVATDQVIDPVPDGEGAPIAGEATFMPSGEVADFYPD